MIEVIKFTFPGEPRAVQSVRFARIGGFVRKYQPKKNEDWKSYIRVSASGQLPGDWQVKDCALSVKAKFCFTPPKSWPKYKLNALRAGARFYKTTKPDLTDNLMKGVIDALTGIAWRDDSVICMVESGKEYSESPRIELVISEIEEDSGDFDMEKKQIRTAVYSAAKGRKESPVCAGCCYLNVGRGRCAKWGGRCKQGDQSCEFYKRSGK